MKWIRNNKLGPDQDFILFRYMSRRCNFLETFPAYNFNQGVGPERANTKKLGSTLMKAMLREVQQYCIKESWSILTHQQVNPLPMIQLIMDINLFIILIANI